MKKLLILIFIIILSYNVLADSQKSIFSGTLRDGESGIADGKNFTVVISGLKVLVDYGDYSFIIKESGCDSQENIKVCIDSVEADDQAVISILKKTSNIVLTKKVPKYAYKSRIFTVDINIKNVDSDIPARNLVFVENISDNFMFIGSSGCNYENGVIIASADLYKNEELTCTYDLISKEAGQYRLFSNIKYLDGDELQEIKKDNSVKVKEYGLNIIVEKLPKDYFDVDENIKFNFNISNDFPDDVKIKDVQLRPRLFKINEENVKKDINMPGNSSRQFFIDGTILGYNNDMEFYIEYSMLGQSYNLKKNINFNLTKIDPEFRFDKYNKIYNSNDKIIFYFRNSGIKNIHGYKNIKLNIKSNILDSNIDKNISLLNYGDESKIELNNKKVSDGRYPVFIKGSYNTLNDELIYFDRTEFIFINNTQKVVNTIINDNINNTNENLSNVNNINNSKSFHWIYLLYIIPVIIIILLIYILRLRKKKVIFE